MNERSVLLRELVRAVWVEPRLKEMIVLVKEHLSRSSRCSVKALGHLGIYREKYHTHGIDHIRERTALICAVREIVAGSPRIRLAGHFKKVARMYGEHRRSWNLNRIECIGELCEYVVVARMTVKTVLSADLADDTACLFSGRTLDLRVLTDNAQSTLAQGVAVLGDRCIKCNTEIIRALRRDYLLGNLNHRENDLVYYVTLDASSLLELYHDCLGFFIPIGVKP